MRRGTDGRAIVATRTKKRALELTGISASELNTYWSETFNAVERGIALLAVETVFVTAYSSNVSPDSSSYKRFLLHGPWWKRQVDNLLPFGQQPESFAVEYGDVEMRLMKSDSGEWVLWCPVVGIMTRGLGADMAWPEAQRKALKVVRTTVDRLSASLSDIEASE